MEYEYTPQECVAELLHLNSCDDDGYCNNCGHQEPVGYFENQQHVPMPVRNGKWKVTGKHEGVSFVYRFNTRLDARTWAKSRHPAEHSDIKITKVENA